MNTIEAFLANQKLYRCERLSANLTKAQCETNRQRKPNFTTDVWDCAPCKGCPGLGEETDMSKRGTCTKCGREDLTLPAEGLCGKCYVEKRNGESRPIPGRRNPAKPKKLKGKTILTDEQRKELVTQKAPVVINKPACASQITVNLEQIIDEAWEQAKAKIMSQIRTGSDPYTQMKQVHETVVWLRSL